MKAGDVVGRYEILVPLARGGMAEVWLARSKGESGFTKHLVVKTILPHLADDAEFEKMFVNEALLASRLSHPHVVQILDLGKSNGRYFIVMEYVPGASLRQLGRAYASQKRLVPPWFVLRAMAAVCEGLQHAHDLCDDDGKPLNIVHRDVSPENIMVSRSGVVKVLDFGVAKATTAATQTQAGTLKGKYSYIAPEVVSGGPVDRRSDVYAVGVVMYELLCGQRPFVGANDLELLRRVMEGTPVPLRNVFPAVPESLEAIVLKAMHANPEARYQQARELADALHHHLDQVMMDRHTSRHLGELVNLVFPLNAGQTAAGRSPEPIELTGSQDTLPHGTASPEPKRVQPPPPPPPSAPPNAPVSAAPPPLPSVPTKPSPTRAEESQPPPPVPSVAPSAASRTMAPATSDRKPKDGLAALLQTRAVGAPRPSFPEVVAKIARERVETEDDARGSQPAAERPLPLRAPVAAPASSRPAWLASTREAASVSPVEDASQTPAWLRSKREVSLAKQLFGAVPPAPASVRLPDDNVSFDDTAPVVDSVRQEEAERRFEWGQVFEREGRLDLAIEEFERAAALVPGQTRYAEHLARARRASDTE